jgi:hypothetical protein
MGGRRGTHLPFSTVTRAHVHARERGAIRLDKESASPCVPRPRQPVFRLLFHGHGRRLRYRHSSHTWECNLASLMAAFPDGRRFDITVAGHTLTAVWRYLLPGNKPRPALICPVCNQPKRYLYLVAGAFICRPCGKLDYACRHRKRWFRFARLAVLRRAIKADPTPLSPLPPRSKHFRVRQYVEAVTEIGKLEAALIDKLHVVTGDLERRRKRKRL